MLTWQHVVQHTATAGSSCGDTFAGLGQALDWQAKSSCYLHLAHSDGPWACVTATGRREVNVQEENSVPAKRGTARWDCASAGVLLWRMIPPLHHPLPSAPLAPDISGQFDHLLPAQLSIAQGATKLSNCQTLLVHPCCCSAGW